MPNRVAFRRHRSRWWSLLLIPILTLVGIANGSAAPPPPDQTAFDIIELAPEAFVAPELSPTSVRSHRADPLGLDSAMTRLSISPPQQARELASSMGLRLSGDRVHVQIAIQASALDSIRQAVTDAGGELTKIADDKTLLQGWLPIEALASLAARTDIFLIRRPEEAVLLEGALGTGSTTEALAALNAPAWHAAGHRGGGVKVGIIDLGFQGYTALRGTDLPATVVVRNFVDGEDDSQVDGTTKHGTSCAEVVYDVAPAASLYLAKIGTSLDLQEAVAWLRDTHSVDVISTSIGYYNVTPGDGTGQFADLVQNARNAGILWVTAAGNDREAHWGGAFADSDGNNRHEFNGKEINCFGPGGDQCYLIPAGYLVQAYLRWDDWTDVDQDYDLHLVRRNGSDWDTIRSSTDRQSGRPGQRPTESALATTFGSATPYGFYIERFSSTRNVNLEIFAPKLARLNELVHQRSLANLGDAPAVLTVAALDSTTPYPQEAYSAEGPTNGFGGTATGGFIKPDLSAYANVSTQGYGEKGFNGTSAATPHVAGAAALVWSANPGYTPGQVQTFLEQRAIDMGSAGNDTMFGHGRLYLGAPPSALPPQVTGITPSSGTNAGTTRIANLAGSGFQSGATVKLSRSGYTDRYAINVAVVSATQITCDLNLTGVPAGRWNVVVTNPDGQSGTLANGFTVRDPAPVVFSITPSSGVYTGWLHISNLSGAYFKPGATVKLTKSNHADIQAASVTWVDANTLTCELDLSGAANGPWNVVVTNSDGQSGTLANVFQVQATATAPRITGVTPNVGRNTDPIPTFIVRGGGFATDFGQQPTVKLTHLGQPDIVATDVSVVDPNTITCRLDLTGVSPGSWNVVVTNPNGEHWTLTDGFSVTGSIYFPIVARGCPPPVLDPIDNDDGDGTYILRWSLASCGTAHSSWELQRDDNAGFDSPVKIPISDGRQTSYGASTPTPGTYYWRVRAYRPDQGWSGWSNVQSVTVREQEFAEVWIDNQTGDTVTVEIVGVAKKSFPTGEYYWLSVTPGEYTIKGWGCGASEPFIGSFTFFAGRNTIKFTCGSAASRSNDSQLELRVTPK